MKPVQMLFLFFSIVLFVVPSIYSQSMDELHGNQNFVLRGLHNGNNVQTTFRNDGQFGDRRLPDDIWGEWPKNSGHYYIRKIVLMVAAQVRDESGNIVNIVSESHGTTTSDPTNPSAGDLNPLNISEWWTMTPLPGFANYNAVNDPELADLNLQENSIAMSHLPWSWPASWPDKLEDMTDPGWSGTWNSYFAKGREFANADQESYFVFDDYQNREFDFYPDSTDFERRGLGVRVQGRGLQWNNPLVRDALFLVYDVTNIGSYNHNRINFIELPGYTIGSYNRDIGNEEQDDIGIFKKDERFIYFYDQDFSGQRNFVPGWAGYSLFETPGNPKDGIDNDGDATFGEGITIEESMFEPFQINIGDPIITIDYSSFERTNTTMPDDTVWIEFQAAQRAVAWPDKVLEELPFDNIDNNLNGIVDENNGALSDTSEIPETKYLYVGRKAIDYFSGLGANNPFIDEKRDNEIDDDSDWDIATDDVGIDGTPGTHDFGEGDGMPNSGYQNGVDTGLPGEPNIDKTDIDESDLLGMTSFLLDDWTAYPIYDDEIIWGATIPGIVNINNTLGVGPTPLMGSGYFPLRPGETERFSGALLYGGSEDELLRLKGKAEEAYKEDYHFFRAPSKPIVKSVAGDGKVTLYWDSRAERSRDPIAGFDFEGYRIYRSTDPQWKDLKQITNAYGTVITQTPLIIFDLNNGIKGLSTGMIEGVQYYLGDDSGLQHSWVDTSVYNGITYYYAVVSFDRGVDSLAIPPTECSRQLTLGQSGEIIDISENVAAVKPEAPAAGYVPAELNFEHVAGSSDGNILVNIVDPPEIKDDNRYRISFQDTIIDASPMTKSLTLVNITSEGTPDSLLENFSLIDETLDSPIIEGFQLFIDNPPLLEMDRYRSKWNDENIYDFTMETAGPNDQKLPSDFKVFMDTVGVDTSIKYKSYRREIPVNFSVFNENTGEKQPFAFQDRDVLAGEEGMFTSFTEGSAASNTDWLLLLYTDSEGKYQPSWRLELSPYDSLKRNPVNGDTLSIVLISPFLSSDTLEFETSSPKESVELAKQELDKVRVVPNPYIVTNSFEPANPYSRGRGPRELHFTHLPKDCIIKIFDIRGQLVQTLDHHDDMDNGTEVWNMLTKDNMEIGFGIYIYHIDAGEIGQKIDKFAVIK